MTFDPDVKVKNTWHVSIWLILPTFLDVSGSYLGH